MNADQLVNLETQKLEPPLSNRLSVRHLFFNEEGQEAFRELRRQQKVDRRLLMAFSSLISTNKIDTRNPNPFLYKMLRNKPFNIQERKIKKGETIKNFEKTHTYILPDGWASEDIEIRLTKEDSQEISPEDATKVARRILPNSFTLISGADLKSLEWTENNELKYQLTSHPKPSYAGNNSGIFFEISPTQPCF